MNVGKQLEERNSKKVMKLHFMLKKNQPWIQDHLQDVSTQQTQLAQLVVMEFVILLMGTTNHMKMEKQQPMYGKTQKMLIVLKLLISQVNRLKEPYMMNAGFHQQWQEL